jgi:Spy/CpxP family protein refolding chaperone
MKKLFFLLFLATMVAWTQPREFENDDAQTGPMFADGRFMEKLDLTADQQKQFDKLRTDMQKKQIELRSKVQTLRLDMKDLFNEDSPDKLKIESTMNGVNKLQSEMKLTHLDFWFEVNKILKPDQQKIWKEHRLMMGQRNPQGTYDGIRKPMGRHGREMRRGECCPNGPGK